MDLKSEIEGIVDEIDGARYIKGCKCEMCKRYRKELKNTLLSLFKRKAGGLLKEEYKRNWSMAKTTDDVEVFIENVEEAITRLED